MDEKQIINKKITFPNGNKAQLAIVSEDAPVGDILSPLNIEKLYCCKNIYKNMISSLDKPFVFLAFSFKDREHAEEIEKLLNERNIRTWMAIREIKPEDDWQLKVKENLQICDYFLALVSSSSNESHWTQWEFQMAINNEKNFKRPHVIPVIIENVIIPHYLNHMHYVDFRPDGKINAEKIINMFEKNEFFEESDE